jgi:hypothetical protein
MGWLAIGFLRLGFSFFFSLIGLFNENEPILALNGSLSLSLSLEVLIFVF